MNITDFPLTLAANSTQRYSDTVDPKFTGRAQKLLSKVVDAVNAAQQDGYILNPVYTEAKTTANSLLEQGWDKVRETVRHDRDTPKDLDDLLNKADIFLYLHTVAGKTKLFAATKVKSPYVDAARAYLAEVKPLADAFATFKATEGFIVKRQPKPVEDRKSKYNAPGASETAIGRVKTLLEEVTNGARDSLRDYFVKEFTRYLTKYMTKQTEANAAGKALAPYDLYRNRRSPSFNIDADEIVSKLVKEGPYNAALRGSVWVAPTAAEAFAIITTEALKVADDIRENFVYKNLAKLDSIVDAKGGLKSGEIVGREISLGGLRGNFRFTFEDGSSFSVVNQVVWSVSVHGNQFQRFPLTFHDVVMADGSKMGRPSEERMNTVFIGK